MVSCGRRIKDSVLVARLLDAPALAGGLVGVRISVAWAL